MNQGFYRGECKFLKPEIAKKVKRNPVNVANYLQGIQKGIVQIQEHCFCMIGNNLSIELTVLPLAFTDIHFLQQNIFILPRPNNFLKKYLEERSLFLRPLIPLFWTSGDVFSGFQGQSGQSYPHFNGLIHTLTCMLHIP